PFSRQLLSSGSRERVIPRPPVVLRCAPLGRDPSVQQQPLEGWVERALTDLEDILGEGFQILRDAVAVLRAPRERFEDEEVERARQEFLRVSHRLSMGGSLICTQVV